MVSTLPPSQHLHSQFVHRLERGEALLASSDDNLLEVVGILKSYGEILDAYAKMLKDIAARQFVNPLPVFKFFKGEVKLGQLWRHIIHDRINFEYAEYCMKAMLWHSNGEFDDYLESPEFVQNTDRAIRAWFKGNPLFQTLYALMPQLFIEHARQQAYYRNLGLFWTVMADIFLKLSDAYDAGEIRSVHEVSKFIMAGLVKDAAYPIDYSLNIRGETYDLIPKSCNFIFITHAAIPYVEAVFLRGTPFPGTVSYNAQAYQISAEQADFTYGALFADPLPIGGAGIPPTQLMQDMARYLPDYLYQFYLKGTRKEGDLLVRICQSFQKSMFCVTTGAIWGLSPHPLDTQDTAELAANRTHFEAWVTRLAQSRLLRVG